MRLTTAGDFTAYEWRVATHGQGDYFFSSGMSVGVFAGVDVFPALGWTTAVTLSLAMF